jgi:2-polyprenyl-3-methyl-5-hydroxy-6-metoxy-1,4-benzoquinol methylase
MAHRADPTDQELSALTRLAGEFRHKRVLEIGCGRGRLTRKYAVSAAHVDAIDPDPKKIAAAREGETPPQLHYHTAALADFSSLDPYDLVILSWSL